MPVLKTDEKGRIQLPREMRKAWNLKPRQSVFVEIKQNSMVLTKAKRLEPQTDPLLKDIVLNPLKSKVKVTKKLLERLEDEQWSA